MTGDKLANSLRCRQTSHLTETSTENSIYWVFRLPETYTFKNGFTLVVNEMSNTRLKTSSHKRDGILEFL